MFLGTAEPLFTIAPDLLSTQFRICNSAGAAQHGNGASFSLLALERVFREYFSCLCQSIIKLRLVSGF